MRASEEGDRSSRQATRKFKASFALVSAEA